MKTNRTLIWTYSASAALALAYFFSQPLVTFKGGVFLDAETNGVGGVQGP